jgi:hypothetical protein
LLQVLLRAIGGSLAGAFIVGLPLFGVLELIPGTEWFAESRWRSAAAGALIGGCIGTIAGLLVYWRVQAIRALANELGMTFIESAESDLGRRLRKLFAASGSAYFRNVMFREMGGVKLWVGDYMQIRSSGNSKQSTKIDRTVALFEKESLALPQFSLQLEGMLLNMMSGIMGIEDIDFDDSPEFSRIYHLSGKPRDAVRQLFQKNVRDFFAAERNWEVRGEEGQLVVLRPRRKLSASMLREFIHEATEIISLFDESAVNCKQLPPPIRVDDGPGAQPSQLQTGYLQSLIVDDDAVAQFLKQPAPRNVPARISRQYLNGGIVFMIIAGGFCVVFGTLWMAAMLVIPAGPKEIMILVGALLAGVGLALLIGGIRSRTARLGLLTNGRTSTSTIDAVEITNVSVNDQPRYLAKVTFYDGKQQVRGSTSVYGAAGDKLREQMARGESVTVLYDPRKPTYFVLATQLASNISFRI